MIDYAFPIAHETEVDDPRARWGMTLRDYFAAKAMQGFCAAGNKISIDPHLFRREAELAYAAADAMLKARDV